MKKMMLLMLIVFAGLITNAQNRFYVGTKSYSCTESFRFTNSSTPQNLDVLIAKDGNNGLIAVSTTAYFSSKIRGNLILYLEDGTVINCIDRNMYDVVDGVSTTVYKLTNAEINKMKYSNIRTIRYSVKSGNITGLNTTVNYTVENRASIGLLYGRTTLIEKTDVPALLRRLF